MIIQGEINAPGDKSISHRAFMLASLARGTSTIRGALDSQDVRSTRTALIALGASITPQGDLWVVEGGALTEPQQVLDAGNSGTTARLLSGILAGIPGMAILTGDSSLIRRPMTRVIEPLSAMGASFLARSGGRLPLAVRGGDLKGITYTLPVPSAQVKSAVLLAGLNAAGRTRVKETLPSRDHTERMLAFFGATLGQEEGFISLKGPQELSSRDIRVPGDPSSAAFPAVWAACTPGSELLIRGVCLNPTRTALLAVLERMGAEIAIENTQLSAGEPVGDILIRGAELKGTIIEGAEIPGLIDEIPILAVAASLARGRTTIRDARELRVKETDRIQALVQGFAALGAEVTEREDGLIIEGPLRLRPGAVLTHLDHRIAMAFHILSRALDIEVTLDDRTCVDISYPGFFAAMEQLA